MVCLGTGLSQRKTLSPQKETTHTCDRLGSGMLIAVGILQLVVTGGPKNNKRDMNSKSN